MANPLPLLDAAAPACCAPISEAPLRTADAEDLARRFKALADPHRLRLLSLIMAASGGEACTCDLTDPLALSQPTVSHHLKKLLDAGLVAAERRGVWTFYRVVPDALESLAAVLVPPKAR